VIDARGRARFDRVLGDMPVTFLPIGLSDVSIARANLDSIWPDGIEAAGVLAASS
jgi:hypothetical protein